MMYRYSWVVLLAGMLAGCGSGFMDIGSPDDMTTRQEKMRENRAIPTAAELPPGLGEDLPMVDVATTPAPSPARPVSSSQ